MVALYILEERSQASASAQMSKHTGNRGRSWPFGCLFHSAVGCRLASGLTVAVRDSLLVDSTRCLLRDCEALWSRTEPNQAAWTMLFALYICRGRTTPSAPVPFIVIS